MRRTNLNHHVLRFFALTLSIMLVWGSMLPAFANEQESALPATLSSIAQDEQEENSNVSAPQDIPEPEERLTLTAATADQLAEIFAQYAKQEIQETTVIRLTADIDLATLSVSWQAPGTHDHPFSGVFDGGGYTITGVGQGEIPSLLGVAAGALIQDVTLQVFALSQQEDSSLYAGLFETGLQVTVLGCTITSPEAPAALLLPMLLNGVLPDTSWYDNTPAASDWTLTAADEIAGIAVLVENGTDFAGKTIYIGQDIDLSVLGTAMQPIGTENKPFKGTIDGNPSGSGWGRATLENMQLLHSGRDNVGFIGYGKEAQLQNLYFKNAEVVGDDNVGIAAGTLKNGHIYNCGTAGSVNGIVGAGGIAGRLQGNTDALNGSTIMQSFSTAHIIASSSGGGIAGICEYSGIEHCFFAGNVAAAIQVGGIVGSMHNKAQPNIFTSHDSRDPALYAVRYCGVSGSITGTGQIAGLVGSSFSTTALAAYGCYSAATLSASSDSGGLLGYAGRVQYSYLSGQIIAPVFDDYYVTALLGFNGIGARSYARADAVKDYLGKHIVDSTSSNLDCSHFTANAGSSLCTEAIKSDIFAPANLTMQATGSYSIPVGGTYPRLLAFEDTTQTPPEFQDFSLLSTQAINAETILYYNGGAGYASATTSGTPYALPELPSNIHWELQLDHTTDTSIIFDDPTLPGGENTIRIVADGGKHYLKLDAPVYKDMQLMLAAIVNQGALDISLNLPITIKDGGVRPVYSQLPVYFHTNAAELDNQNTVTQHNRSFILRFPEAIQRNALQNNHPLGADVTAILTQYDSYDLLVNNSNGQVMAQYQHSTAPITLQVQKDTQLKLEWPADVISSGKYYALTLKGLLDEAGQTMTQQTYYLRSLPNQAPTLNFDPDVYDYYGQAITDNNTGTQTVRIRKDDPNYRSYCDGVIAEDDYDNLVVKPGNVSFSNIGNNNAPGITKDNFHQYWGVYQFTYQVQDSEGEASRQLTRIYEVYCDIEITANGQPIQAEELNVYLNNDRLLTIMEELADGTSPDLKTALEQQILLESQFHASRMTCDGTVEQLELELHLGSVGMQNLIQSGRFDGMTYNLVYQGTPVMQNIPLRVTGSTGVRSLLTITENTANLSAPVGSITTLPQVQQLIAPKIQYTKNNSTVTIDNVTLSWSANLNFTSLNTQFITLSPQNVLGLGFDLTSKIYSATFTQSGMTITPPSGGSSTDSDRANDTFWEDVKAEIQKAAPGKTVTAKVDYQHMYAPVSVFETLKEQPGVTLLMKLEKGIEIALPSSKVDLSRVEPDRYQININIVPMDNLYISRDIPALGPMQQLYTVGRHMAYGTVEVTIPADEALRGHSGQLALYTFDNSTKEYTLVQRLLEGTAKGSVVFSLKEMPGEMVIAPFPLKADKTNPDTGE